MLRCDIVTSQYPGAMAIPPRPEHCRSMSFSPARPHADPAAEAATLLCRIGLAILGIAVPCAATGARRAVFVLMPVGSVLILISALLDSGGEGRAHLRNGVLTIAGIAAVFLLAWASLSLLWTPFRLEAAARFSKEAGTMLLALIVCAFLPERTRISNLNLWPVGVGLAGLATLGVALAGPTLLAAAQEGENSTSERGLLSAVVLLWPALAALALRQRWNSAGGIAIVVAVAAILVWSPAGLIGLIAGALVFAAAANHPARAAPVLALGFVALLVAAPALPFAMEWLGGKGPVETEGFSGAVQSNARVWAQIIRNDGWRLLPGHGIDSSTRGMAGGFLPARTPHSLLFELWFELGALGVAAFAVMVWQGFAACGRQAIALAPFLLAGLTSLLVVAILGFSLSQLWWVTVIGIVGIATTHVLRGQYLTRRPHIEPARMRAAPPQQAMAE